MHYRVIIQFTSEEGQRCRWAFNVLARSKDNAADLASERFPEGATNRIVLSVTRLA